jgi:hypothetical protein
MSTRKEPIRIDAGSSSKWAKQSRLQTTSKNTNPAAKGRRLLVGTGILLIGCMTLALGVAFARGLSTNGAMSEALDVEPLMPMAQPVALAVTRSPVSNKVDAVQALGSSAGLPLQTERANSTRAKGAVSKDAHASLFACLDANRDGFVSYAEYGVLARNKQKHRGQILALDKDKDGRITEQEFRRVVANQLRKWLDVQE